MKDQDSQYGICYGTVCGAEYAKDGIVDPDIICEKTIDHEKRGEPMHKNFLAKGGPYEWD